MADHPDDPVDPFPTDFPEPPPSRFPPVEPDGHTPVDASDPPSDWNARADAHDLPLETKRASRLKMLGQMAFPPPMKRFLPPATAAGPAG